MPAIPAQASRASYDRGDTGQPAFTKLYGQGAIYAISFVAEEIARAAAVSFRVAPVTPYEIPELRQLRMPGSASSPTGDTTDEVNF